MEFFTHSTLKDGDVIQFDGNVSVFDHPKGHKQLAQEKFLTGDEDATPLPEKQLFLVLSESGHYSSISNAAMHTVKAYQLVPIDPANMDNVNFKDYHVVMPLDKGVLKSANGKDNDLKTNRDIITPQQMHIVGHIDYTRTLTRRGDDVSSSTTFNTSKPVLKDIREVDARTGKFKPAAEVTRDKPAVTPDTPDQQQGRA
jgi:hypothetical protein